MESAAFDLAGTLGTAASNLTTQIGSIVPVALGVAITVLGITLGWRLFKKFVKG